MLTKITIENFKSFKESTTIDFHSTNYKILQKTNVYDDRILKGAIFVGGNAAGKTNVILAIKLLLDLLFKEKTINIGIYKCLFSENPDIKLNYEFDVERTTIKYEIEFNVQKKVLMEKLFIDDEIVIDRIGQTGRSKLTENMLHENLDSQTLLLRTIYFNTKFNKFLLLRKWFDYLSNSFFLDASVKHGENYGNSHFSLKEYLDDKGVNDINNFFKEYNFEQSIEYSNESKGNLYTIDTTEEKSVFFKRKGIGEPIPYFWESLGNRNLINMLPAFFQVVENGGMLIIDEFSSAFHNELEELLIRYFMEKSHKSQIFLVSHSTNLLSNTIFRPDQEFSVEFKNFDGSKVNRFSNDKPREAQNIEKMYNSGVFGGKPAYKHE